MIKRILFAALLLAILPLASCGNKSNAGAQADAEQAEASANSETTDSIKDMKVKFETTLGDFTVLLYDDTPEHRDNMVKLVNDHFYDGLLFHRVIKDFMVQGGDPDSKDAVPGQMLGSGGPNYTIPAEIRPNHFHTRYALAAARTGDQINPERRSSGSQFYVVTGSKVDSTQLMQQVVGRIFQDLAQQNIDKIRQMQAEGDHAGLNALQAEFEAQATAKAADLVPAEIVEKYATVGGAPFLDGQYTVYGEVIDGFSTIDAIEKVETGAADRPVNDVRILKAYVVD